MPKIAYEDIQQEQRPILCRMSERNLLVGIKIMIVHNINTNINIIIKQLIKQLIKRIIIILISVA